MNIAKALNERKNLSQTTKAFIWVQDHNRL